MTKLQKDFIIRLAFFLILLIVTFLPYGDNTVKGFGRIIIFTSISSEAIQNVLSKGNKKDISILIISYMILCIAMLLPTNMFAIRMIGLLVFAVELFKEDITTYFKRPKKDKS